jgi:hypothetical protein
MRHPLVQAIVRAYDRDVERVQARNGGQNDNGGENA